MKELRLRLPEAEFTGVVADLSTSEGSSILADQIADADIGVNVPSPGASATELEIMGKAGMREPSPR